MIGVKRRIRQGGYRWYSIEHSSIFYHKLPPNTIKRAVFNLKNSKMYTLKENDLLYRWQRIFNRIEKLDTKLDEIENTLKEADKTLQRFEEWIGKEG